MGVIGDALGVGWRAATTTAPTSAAATVEPAISANRPDLLMAGLLEIAAELPGPMAQVSNPRD